MASGTAMAADSQQMDARQDHVVDLQGAYFHLMQGYDHAQSGRLQAAMHEYNRAIDLHPAYLHAWLFRGKAAGRAGQTDKALSDYAHALKLQPGNTEVIAQRAVSYHNSRQFRLAVADYSYLLSHEPGNLGTLMKRGMANVQLRDCTRAMADFDEILSLDATHAEAIAGRGDCFRLTGNIIEAEAAYQWSLKVKPQNAAALNGQLMLLGDLITTHEDAR